MSQSGDESPPSEPDEPSSEGESDPLESISKQDWREFRAALVVGSAEALEKSKETAYRTGHWAHPVRHR